MKLPFVLLLAWIAAGPLAAAPAPTASATLGGDAAHPPAAHWLRSELYFGLGRAAPSDDGVSEAQWRRFLDEEVSPRFPDGLSVLEAYGQWRNPSQPAPERLRSKVLVILHEDSPAARQRLDEIRTAWKQRTHDRSVLLVTAPAEVSFE